MDKQQARHLISETFETPFDKAKFTSFIKNLLNQIEETPTTVYRGNLIPDAYEQYISSLERIGKYTDGKHKIDILVVRLKKETSIERGRTMQRNFIAWYLNGSRGGVMKDAALAAFVSPNNEDWRFSLVKMDYRFEEGKGGKTKVKEEFTPARRWSFLVGKNENSHTAQSTLVPIMADDRHNPGLAELEQAFNIEKVTKEFFEKYRDLFLWTKETLDDTVKKDKKIREDFESKGVDTVDFSKKLLGQIVFLYFLQKKGWFGVKRDAADWGTGPKNFLRELFEGKHGTYKNFFNDILEPLFYKALAREERDNDFYSRFNCKIPFLNGGLFDPINNYDWVHTDILLPNDLFSNSYKTKEGDIGNGILDIFDRYNFTVKEDEPLEKEVAVDPEMLGKVFENLIEENLRKGQGAYYTPREIVHYMCQESLINYLGTELEDKVTKADIELFIKHGEHLIENEKTALQKEEDIKSGKQKSTTIKSKMPESIKNYAKQIDEKLANIRVCDPAVGSGAFPVGMMLEIVKARNVLTNYLNEEKERTPYNFKRNCIENCLYGVDIDSSAIDIAKLRFWLSLVVDEEDVTKIKPLPNLDYKLVCGNSLLGVERDLLNDHLFKELEKLKPLHLNETDMDKKLELKRQIDKLIKQITNNDEHFDFQVYFSEVFHKKQGFDIVIANPPYIDSESMVRQGQSIIRNYITKNYNTAKGNWDLYIPFWELGFKLINSKGSAVFITPNKWLAIGYGKALRKLLRPYVYKVCNCDLVKVFEAGNSPVVIFVSKFRTNNIQIDKFGSDYDIDRTSVVSQKLLSEENWGFLLSQHIQLVIKMRGCPKKINSNYYAENPFTVSEAYKFQEILSDLKTVDAFNDSQHFKFVNTGTIEKYYFLWSVESTAYLKKKYLIPVVDKKMFKRKFPKRFNQTNMRKLIISGIRHFECAPDFNGNIIAGKSTIILKNKSDTDLKIALALLNSNLISFYIREAFGALGIGGGINFTAELVENLPFPNISSEISKKIRNIVDQILGIMENKEWLQNLEEQTKVKEYEHQIDQMVYKLYGLTDEEIKIVAGFGKED